MNPQTSQIREARAFVDCFACDELKPAAGFRQVIGRITTEACGECCDRRDEADSSQQTAASRTEVTREAITEFCRRVAVKRFERQDRPLSQAVLTSFQAAPNFIGKEKSALARDPKEYAAWLQRFPDRVAAIVAKTYAIKGDAAELDDSVALVRIMDLLNAGDSTLIERNANKKLAPKKS